MNQLRTTLVAILLFAPNFALAQATAATLNRSLQADLTVVNALLAAICALGQLYYFSAGIFEALKGGSIWTVMKYIAMCMLLPSAILSYTLFS